MEVAAPAPRTVDEAVADVASRFLTPLQPSETSTVERLFGHIQQAHWFYVDEMVPMSGGSLPKMSSWDFCEVLFRVCPMLEPYRSRSADFLAQYKAHLLTVPVHGVILLTRDCRHVLLVRGMGAKSWSFPRGKVNEGESGVACAVREVLEETGYDCRAALAWTAAARGAAGGGGGAALPHTLHPPHLQSKEGGKTVTMYVAVGVPDDGSVVFRPRTKSEIDSIGWFDTATLFALAGVTVPGAAGGVDAKVSRGSLRAVLPFLPALHEVLVKHGRLPAPGGAGGKARPAPGGPGTPYLGGGAAGAGLAGVPSGASPATGKGKAAAKPARKAGAVVVAGKATHTSDPARPPPVPLPDAPDHLVAPLGAGVGDSGGGWSVRDMWATNAALLQKRFVYDGNPHTFGDDAVAAVPITRAPAAPVAPPLASATRPAPTTAPAAPVGKTSAPRSARKRSGRPAHHDSAAAVTMQLQGTTPPPANAVIDWSAPFRFDMDAITAAMALPALSAAAVAAAAPRG